MKESNKQQTPRKQVKQLASDQNLKTQILQNLNKQSALSHHHQLQSSFSETDKKSFSQIDKKSTLNQQTTQRSTVNKKANLKINIFNLQSARQQIEDLKNQNNQFLNQEEINNKILMAGYFSHLSKQIIEKKTNSTSKNYSSKIENNLQENINSGVIRISNHQQDIKNLLVQFKLSNQELKLLQKRANAQLKQQKLSLLDPFQQIKLQKQLQNSKISKQQQSQEKKLSSQKLAMNNFVSNSILSKQEHKRLIQRFRLSNKNNQQKQRQKLFELQQRQRSLQYEKKLAQQQSIKKQKQFRRLSIERKLAKRKQNHEGFILQQKVSTQKYRQMKKKKFLYENMQEKYKSEIVIPALQQKKMKLKQIRDFQKKYDIDEIKKHEQEYLQKKSQTSSKHNSRHKINTFHYHPPQRSKKLTQLLEEQQYRAKIKFQEKKRVVQQNKIKQVNFLSDMKIKFKPKIDLKKRQQIQKRLKSQQDAIMSRSIERDPKLLGMKYFEQAKKVIKKKDKVKTQTGVQLKQNDKKQKQKIKQKTQGNEFSQRQQYDNQFVKNLDISKVGTNRPSKRINISYSQNSNHKLNLHDQKRKQIRKIINSNSIQRQVKLQRLKIQNERINEIYKRRQKFFRQNEDDQKTRQQAVGLLLNSIQTKMGIIDICTKN